MGKSSRWKGVSRLMLEIAKKYIEANGSDVYLAAQIFCHDLMEAEPKTFKQGYTRENAILATLDAFDMSDLQEYLEDNTI